jgi:FkbM family methyltransferase
MVAIALSDLFSTEICLHVMDDQCLFEDEIPDALMAEAMNKSNLVFVISPEMRQAYQRRFPNRLYILPPVVPATMILHGENLSLENQPTDAKPPRSKWTDWLPKLSRRSRQQKPGERGIILGNIWNERWLDQLQTTISGSGYEVDWFCNNPDAILLSVQRDELERSGIHLQNPLWGDDLVDELRRRPFAIMPSGALNPEDERQSLARLSLPSRVPFVIAVSHAPIIVLGSPETAAARFVRRFELGTVVDYDPLQFKSAIDQILSPQTQSAIRQRAQQLAPAFSARGIRRWLEESIPLKQPVDNRFETLFSQKKVSNSKPALPIRRANWNKEKLWKLLRRLSNQGIEIQNIIDIGSGDGAWSWAASQVFPAAKYLLIEPQLSRYSLQDRRLFERSLLESHVLELKIFDADSDSDLSQFNAAETKNQRTPPADMLAALQDTNSTAAPNTLDQIVLQHQISGVTLLRMDVQRENFAALAGSIRLIRESAAAIILTADVNSDNLQAKSYGELLTLMDSLGFNLTDETVAKRCPRTEILLSKNLVFVKKEICQKQLSTPAA